MGVFGKRVIVTGGSRGLGLGLVEVLVAEGADVTVVARDVAKLDAVRRRLGVNTAVADVVNGSAASQLISGIRPDIVVLNAGATPPMASIDVIAWEDFTTTWETDVKAGLGWIQAALNAPMPRGGRILIASSGAANGGSPLSGGYGGAKRTLWMMAGYANKVSRQRGLDLLFQAIAPLQMVADTGVGEAASNAYAASAGVDAETFRARFGVQMTPQMFGRHVLGVLSDARYDKALTLGFKGDSISVLEDIAA